MIAARSFPQPTPPRRPLPASISARRRERRARLRGYALLGRMVVVLALALVPVMGYVMLTANLTSLSYALEREKLHRTALLEETTRLDDQIAHLLSRDRLADLATRMKMHDPTSYAVVELPHPAPPAAPSGIALLGYLFRH